MKTKGIKKDNFWLPKVGDLGEGNNKTPEDKVFGKYHRNES